VLRRMRHRLRSEGGFAVIESVVVLAIVGAVAVFAVPSVLGFRSASADNATKASLRAAMPAAETYFADRRTYVGLDSTDLIRIDPRISLTVAVTSANRRSYCLTDSVKGKTWSVRGPNSTLVSNTSATKGWFEGDTCR
jgi:type IV pilus assembly protein PilA